MKKMRVGVSILIGLIIFVVAVLGVWSYYFRGSGPAFLPVITPITNILPSLPLASISPATPEDSDSSTQVGPLTLPAGFTLSSFAKDLPGVRVMVRDGFGHFWVSQPSQGQVTQLEVKDGVVVGQHAMFRNLRKPHGLAIDPENGFSLYIAEENKISRVPLYSDGSMEKIADLPTGGGHSTRTIGFGPDGRLYVSSGSSCNVCIEKDQRRATIMSMNKDGSDQRMWATGLRNSVFFTWSPFDKRMWATDMGRDLLGDNTPPDEVNIIEQDGFYGWPYCYGKNIHDTSFDASAAAAQRCNTAKPSAIDIQAHSAPLGLGFVPSTGWPQEFRGDLLVAYHGSWNRSEPTGYKVVRYRMDEKGTVQGMEDFITGWLSSDGVLGRPVDVRVEENGIIYITDDKTGAIYKVELS